MQDIGQCISCQAMQASHRANAGKVPDERMLGHWSSFQMVVLGGCEKAPMVVKSIRYHGFSSQGVGVKGLRFCILVLECYSVFHQWPYTGGNMVSSSEFI